MNKDGRYLGYMLIAVVIAITVSYYIGRRDMQKQYREEAFNTLKHFSDSVAVFANKRADSLQAYTDARESRYDSISKYKQKVRYEIKEIDSRINAIIDSKLQRYVDSIRANGGFH